MLAGTPGTRGTISPLDYGYGSAKRNVTPPTCVVQEAAPDRKAQAQTGDGWIC